MATNMTKEMREIVAEAKGLFVKLAFEDGALSSGNSEDVTASIKAMVMLNRLTNLYMDLFEKQVELMDKMDAAMDKYLNA